MKREGLVEQRRQPAPLLLTRRGQGSTASSTFSVFSLCFSVFRLVLAHNALVCTYSRVVSAFICSQLWGDNSCLF